jgi:uncharacterized protein YecE (DUF72 family)
MKPGDAPLPDPLHAVRAAGPRIRVGIGGWTFAPWRDNFYPAGLAQRRELEYASRQVSAIEVNGTWYGAQKPATYAKWRDETPPGFRFSLKAPRHIVERSALAAAGGAVRAFVEGGIAELGDRLGPVLWQFPPSRRFDAADFGAFLELLPRTLDGAPLRHVLEVRNPGFLCDAHVDLMRSHGLPGVYTDSGEYPSFADVTGDFVYARLMQSRTGIPSGYPPEALAHWAERARIWADGAVPDDLPCVQPARKPPRQPRDVFVFFIGAGKARNPAAATRLIAALGAG